MRVVIQRVQRCSVEVEGKTIGEIGKGLAILLGVEEADTQDDIDWLCGKISRLRIFDDENGVMNLDIQQAGGRAIVISQFTLFASTKKGNRPSYIRSAGEAFARPMYEKFLATLSAQLGSEVEHGEFGADMQVSLVNDGPVTICIDSKNREKMKKVALLLLSVFAVIGANAQTGASMKRVLEGSMILAQRNLSEDGKEFVKSFLGQSFYEDVQYLYYLEKKNQAEYSSDIHFLYLDKNFRPMEREGDDLIVKIEESMAIVRDREGRERAEVVKALRTIINLMSDMHNIGHVRLESVPHSMQDFKIWRYNGDTPKYNKRKYQVEWSRFWNVYSGSHSGMTGTMWADDYEYAYGDKANEYAAGSLYDWVADIGKSANEIYKWAAPDYEMSRIQRNDLEDFYFEMMAKLGYRLAKMLDMLAQQQ